MEEETKVKEQKANENISNPKQDKASKSKEAQASEAQVQLSKSNQNSKSLKDTNTKKNKSENKMREVEIEKMVLHCGGTEEKHEKSVQLLEMITGSKKIYIVKSQITSINKDNINNHNIYYLKIFRPPISVKKMRIY